MTKTYIYHVLIGHAGKTETDAFIFARNAKEGRRFCNERFRNKHYDYYKFVKIGASFYPRETQFVSKEDEEKMRKYIKSDDDVYSERIDIPEFVSADEMKELKL